MVGSDGREDQAMAQNGGAAMKRGDLVPVLSDADWWGDLRETAADCPRGWRFVFDGGEDECAPRGWYAEGLNAGGWKITFPARHEYGPFTSKPEAMRHAKLIEESYSRA
jgi:hypothetical protein